MKVSVIIPFFNRSHTIERCLISVQQQTCEDFECLIVNDGSQPPESQSLRSTVAELQDHRFQIIEMSKNLGGGAARNQGIERARGEYVAFLDSDDEWLPQKLEKQLEFSVNEQQAFVSCQSFVHHADGVGVLPTVQFGTKRISDYLFVKGGWIQTSSFFLERKALGFARFDENLPRHQDYDLLFQLEHRGIRPALCMEPLVRVRWEDFDSSGRAINVENSKAFALSRRKHFSKVSYSCFVAKFVLIPTIKSKGRISGLQQILNCGIGYLANLNLAIEVVSTIVFKDSRLLTFASKMKKALT